jgi:hypothetical protein
MEKVAEVDAAVPDADADRLERSAPDGSAGELVVDKSTPGTPVKDGDDIIKPVEVAKAVVDDSELVTPCELVKSIRDGVTPDTNDEGIKVVTDEALLANVLRAGTGVERDE